MVTFALLFSLKGVGDHLFYRWIVKGYNHWVPIWPHRSRWFRLFNIHGKPFDDWGIDTYGIELIHLRRARPSQPQMGRRGLSNQPWIVGGKLDWLLDQLAQIVDCDTTNLYHGYAFQHIVDDLKEEMVVLADQGFASLDWLSN